MTSKSLDLKKTLRSIINDIFYPSVVSNKRGFIGEIISWFIRIVIYDICITTIQEVTGVSRMVALFIFLGILSLIAFVGYVIKQRMSPGVDDEM